MGGAVHQEAKGTGGGSEIQDILAGEVWCRLGQHQRVCKKLEESTTLEVTGQAGGSALGGLGHGTECLMLMRDVSRMLAARAPWEELRGVGRRKRPES